MNIIAKHIRMSDVVCMFDGGVAEAPEPGRFFSIFGEAQTKGSMFSDNASIATRIFALPEMGAQWIFESRRIRIEDKAARKPADSKLAVECERVLRILYPASSPTAHGFNFDVIYRFDSVIPVTDIMEHFLRRSQTESVSAFGWQYTITKEKGRRSDTYFFKTVSPIELAVRANIHMEERGYPKDLEERFERGYAQLDEMVRQSSFMKKPH